MIPDEVVEQVQAAADIVGIIGEHVRLKRVGSVFRGPCPFHQGTNANFSVVPGGGYHCFVCHEKGSVFTFVQKRLGLTFVEAVKYVGAKSGIEVREGDRRRDGPDPREPLWELNAAAAAWFSTTMWDGAGGKAARDYLERRGLSRATSERFSLGFAPPEVGRMRGYLNGLGYDDGRLIEAGLLARRDESDEPRPRFRDRLMFPISDATGHVVGFGGRLLGAGEPKYLNSPEGPVFSKGRLLYNYHQARNAARRAERVILVEGYFDVIRLVEAGLEEVVAPMGTALTDSQADLLARCARAAFLLYDSDGPGQRASFRTADVLLAHGLTVRIVTLPDGDDPDTFVALRGRAALDAVMGQSLDVFDRKIQMLERGGWFGDLQRKRRALDRLLPTIRAASDPLTRDLYVARTAEAAGVDKAVIARELELAPRRPAARHASRGGPEGPARGEAQRRDARRGSPGDSRLLPRDDEPLQGDVALPAAAIAPEGSAERELIRVMLVRPDYSELVVEEVARMEADGGEQPDVDGDSASAGAIRHPAYAAIFAALAAGPGVEAEALAEQLGVAENGIVEALRAEPGAIVDPEKTVSDSLALLRARSLRERLDELARMLPLAEEAEKPALLRREAELREELRAVGGRDWHSVRRQVV
ncbi:MAG: DNA primase [Gemmatimonadaceae bacterium]|nr:DNA primase [Gemmatimonadaceae bacterium]